MLPSTNKNTGLLANCVLGNLYSLSLKQKGVEVTENVFFKKVTMQSGAHVQL